jgi:hypothetical protein
MLQNDVRTIFHRQENWSVLVLCNLAHFGDKEANEDER